MLELDPSLVVARNGRESKSHLLLDIVWRGVWGYLHHCHKLGRADVGALVD